MSPTKPLHIRLTFKNLLIFQFFFFAMHELHELAHIITGRLLCGTWGTRDFNVWRLSETCKATHPEIATFAGPVFTFAMLWLGRYWLKHGATTNIRSFGLVMIFGNMPFGRVYMAAMGSGDEMSALRSLFLDAGHADLLLLRIINFVVISAICLPPLITAYKAITNRGKILLFTALLIVPLILDTIILLILLNGLLVKGILNQVFIIGTPVLVTLWFTCCILIVGIGFKCLANFAVERAGPHRF